MSASDPLLVACASPEELLPAIREVVRDCPRETKMAVLRIWGQYRHFFGTQGVFERLNNRTVQQILSEYECAGIRPIASGEIEGLRYAVYDALPNAPNEKGDDSLGEGSGDK